MMQNEEDVLKWMRARVNSGDFDDAASLAREFLTEHKIHDVMDPAFQQVMDAGFKLAGEIAQARP